MKYGIIVLYKSIYRSCSFISLLFSIVDLDTTHLLVEKDCRCFRAPAA